MGGGTVFIENPVDCGLKRSPHFRWAAREHGSLWLMPHIRQLIDDARAAGYEIAWATFPMCAMGGEYQKYTTVLAIGPRAHRVRVLNTLACTHAKHKKVAAGYDEQGSSNSQLPRLHTQRSHARCSRR